MTKGFRSNHGPTEQMIHQAVCSHLLWRAAPSVVWFHVPNGGWRSATEARIMKGLGVKAGVADLILVHAGRFYALELKTQTGKATPAQLAFNEHWSAAGGVAHIAYGLDDALAWLKQHGLLQRGDHARPAITGKLGTIGA